MELVEPDDQNPKPRDEVLATLRSRRILEKDSDALARIFDAYIAATHDGEAGPERDLEVMLTSFVILACGAFKSYPESSTAAVLHLLRRLTLEAAGPPRKKRALWARRRVELLRPLLAAWLDGAGSVDLTAGLRATNLPENEECPSFLGLALRLLCKRGHVDLPRLLDPEFIRTLGRDGQFPGLAGVTDLRTWLWLLGPRAFAAVLPVVEREPDDKVGELLQGVLRAAMHWSTLAHQAHPGNPGPIWVRCAPHLARLAQHLHGRLAQHGDDLPFLGAFWWCSWQVAAHRPDMLDSAVRRAACETATRALGKLRPLLRDAKRPEAAKDYADRFLPLDEAVRVLIHAEGLWPAMKSLLLAFAALSVPAVAADLRYWNEVYLEPVPQPWAHLPGLVAGIVHGYAGAEERRDPGLQRLREELGSFCLERLKTRDGKQVEPRVAWRQCCVRAFRELRVNPRGTGHHVLHQASLDDPNPDVRAAAREAYDETRREVLLPPGSSPRRAIFAAFWWLRQAHLFSVGSKVDSQGAQRTRQKETRRTKEEDMENDQTVK